MQQKPAPIAADEFHGGLIRGPGIVQVDIQLPGSNTLRRPGFKEALLSQAPHQKQGPTPKQEHPAQNPEPIMLLHASTVIEPLIVQISQLSS